MKPKQSCINYIRSGRSMKGKIVVDLWGIVESGEEMLAAWRYLRPDKKVPVTSVYPSGKRIEEEVSLPFLTLKTEFIGR